MKTIAAHLADLGAPAGCRMWTLQRVRGVQELKPRGGAAIALQTVLPPGATITIGEESGVIEYSPTGSGYVRLFTAQDFDTPHGLLVDLIDSDASITI